MKMDLILSLADDATGAMEVGARFAAAGAATWVAFDDAARPAGAEAFVIDTETRHLPAAESYRRIRSLASGSMPHLYKKTDSTLRGNIAAEFRALLEAFPERSLVYAPAYPALGRTVSGGELLVNGRRLRESPFASDPLNPVQDGFIPALLCDCGVPVEVIATPEELARGLRRSRQTIYVCDASCDADLVALAAVLRARTCLAAGAGAFAGFWIEDRITPALPRRFTARRCVVVNGSLHPVSRRQIEAGADLGWPIFTTPTERVADAQGELARRVMATLESNAADGLVVFGGDTLFAILRALEIGIVESGDELLPGVPVSRARWHDRDLTLITKAGGFGGGDLLAAIGDGLESRI